MPKTLEELASPFLKGLIPYVPGKPVEEVERELGIKGAVKLASNENPLGPSPLALRALREALPDSHRYPDGGGYYLKRALADRLGV
ncbi:MAG TPA: histidinol-phosphate transaminase, partial [Candidatus Methylomirabilis sp.]|nr:histidinol-phosphate transaminase [Candidatus Methylomirabilis sp.]